MSETDHGYVAGITHHSHVVATTSRSMLLGERKGKKVREGKGKGTTEVKKGAAWRKRRKERKGKK